MDVWEHWALNMYHLTYNWGRTCEGQTQKKKNKTECEWLRKYIVDMTTWLNKTQKNISEEKILKSIKRSISIFFIQS